MNGFSDKDGEPGSGIEVKDIGLKESVIGKDIDLSVGSKRDAFDGIWTLHEGVMTGGEGEKGGEKDRERYTRRFRE